MAKVIFLSVEKPLSRVSKGDIHDLSLEWFLESNSDGQFLVTKKDGGFSVAKAVIEEVEEVKPKVEKPEIKEKENAGTEIKIVKRVSGTGSKKPKGKGRTGTARNK